MIYLRHHQFPSPLLDWTKSPFIALFFAFNSISDAKTVAVFAYQETKTGGKDWSDSQPSMAFINKSVRAHKRHHLQQSCYTVCLQEIDGHMYYVKHEQGLNRNDSNQDVITKYVLPVTLRKEVMGKLDLMNINEYSLFSEDESLVKSLANRVFLIEELD
jgi:LytS/YehU family sensor histidine kinase